MEEMTTFWVNERNTAEDWNEVSRSLCKSGMQKEKSFRSSKSTEFVFSPEEDYVKEKDSKRRTSSAI
jgi:hypothetical protein